MSIGLPYADGIFTNEGIVRVCPACSALILEPLYEFDEDGEYWGKDRTPPMPSPFELHWTVYHGGQRGTVRND